MPFSSFCFKTFWGLYHKKSIDCKVFFLHLQFFRFTAAIVFFVPRFYIKQLRKHHLFLSKHFHHGGCNFHDLIAQLFVVDLISMSLMTHFPENGKIQGGNCEKLTEGEWEGSVEVGRQTKTDEPTIIVLEFAWVGLKCLIALCLTIDR